eukprot:TRINITY_DN7705_c3_g1_i2.p2 TRINITY_DN7705_c3_g1~~TRINITY_DN7705_c3_g1_i2.p2  ORF type:complete len:100 (+),score=6.12 TRINITY_DN7705_c3_g1_i2:45-302(+)
MGVGFFFQTPNQSNLQFKLNQYYFKFFCVLSYNFKLFKLIQSSSENLYFQNTNSILSFFFQLKIKVQPNSLKILGKIPRLTFRQT